MGQGFQSGGLIFYRHSGGSGICPTPAGRCCGPTGASGASACCAGGRKCPSMPAARWTRWCGSRAMSASGLPLLTPAADRMRRRTLLRPVGRKNGAGFSRPLRESGGVKHTRQSGDGIVAGDAVFQFQGGLREEGWQEFPLGVAEKFQIGSAPVRPPRGNGGGPDGFGATARGSSWALNRLANSVIAASPLLRFNPRYAPRYATGRWPLSYRTPQNPYATALRFRRRCFRVVGPDGGGGGGAGAAEEPAGFDRAGGCGFSWGDAPFVMVGIGDWLAVDDWRLMVGWASGLAGGWIQAVGATARAILLADFVS